MANFCRGEIMSPTVHCMYRSICPLQTDDYCATLKCDFDFGKTGVPIFHDLKLVSFVLGKYLR